MDNQHQRRFKMEKYDIERKLIEKYGHQDFELIQWGTSREPVVFKCLKCGEITKLARLDGLFSKDRKNLCSKCRSYSLRSSGIQLKSQFEDWYSNQGQEKYDLIQGFTTAKGKITLRCKKCGQEQNRDVKKLLENDKCLACERKIKYKKAENQFDEELKERTGGEYRRIGEYINVETPILFEHTLCGKKFTMSPHRLLTDRGRCPCYTRKSKGEEKIKKILNKFNIKYEQQYRLNRIKKAPFDFYLSEYNILIEYQGIQHFQPVECFGGEKQLAVQQEIDERKKHIAIEDGYKLIYFDYTEKDILEETLVQRLSQMGVHSSEWKEQTSLKKDDDIV